MPQSWESHFKAQEAAALGEWIAKVEGFCKAMNQGRNLDCWPVCSFGWKDADLDPEGCTGIKSIDGATDDSFTITIGGHKTVCPDDESESKTEEIQELVFGCGFGGDWTGDDWCLSFSETLQVPWQWRDKWSENANAKSAARRIIAVARRNLRPFHAAMKLLSDGVDSLYEPSQQD